MTLCSDYCIIVKLIIKLRDWIGESMQDSKKTANTNIKVGIVISYITLGVTILLYLLYTPFCLEKLGDSEYGLRSFAMSITSYLSILTMGLSSAYIRFRLRSIKKDEENGEKKFNAIYLTIFSIIALIAVVIGIIFVLLFKFDIITLKDYSGADKAILINLLIVLGINISVSFPLSIFTQYCMAREKFIWVRLMTLIIDVGVSLLGVVVLLLGYKSVALTIVTLGVNVLIGLLNIIYCFAKLKMKMSFKLSKEDFGIVKEMLTFSIFVGINTIVDELNSQTDPVIIGILVGTEAVTIFNLGRQFRTYLMQMSTAISSSFAQRVNEYVIENKETELNKLFLTVSSFQMIVLFLITGGFICCGKNFISLWIGDSRLQSYDIAVCIMAMSIVPLSQNISIEVQRAKNKHKFRAIAYLFIAIFNVLISIILCKHIGIMGCVIGTVVALVLGQYIAINYYNYKVIRLPIKKYWLTYARYFVATALATGFTLLLGMTLKNLSNLLQLLINGVIFVVLFIAINLLINRKQVFATIHNFFKGDL